MEHKRTVFRVGDQVQIVTPVRVIRAGYPLDKEGAKKLITEKEILSIKNLLWSNIDLLNFSDLGSFPEKPYWKTKAYEKIIDILAYCKLKENNFGGRTRQLFTTFDQNLTNKIGQVIRKKVVRTGEYYPPSYFKGYFDDYGEYDPGGLRNAKCHIVLQLDISLPNCWSLPFLSKRWDAGVWVEAKNVQKYKQALILHEKPVCDTKSN